MIYYVLSGTLDPTHSLNTTEIAVVMCVKQLREEIGRCEQLKRQTVEAEVLKARSELVELWNKCCVSQQQRSAFTAISDGCFTVQFL